MWTGDFDPLIARQQLSQMRDVEIVIAASGSGQLSQLLNEGWLGAARRRSALVAMHQGFQTQRFIALPNPSHLATAPAQQLAGFAAANLVRDQPRDDLATASLFFIQGDCPHAVSMRTFSLSS